MRVDPNYVSSLVASLNNSTLSEQKLTAELSSGLRVSSLSTDPVERPAKQLQHPQRLDGSSDLVGNAGRGFD